MKISRRKLLAASGASLIVPRPAKAWIHGGFSFIPSQIPNIYEYWDSNQKVYSDAGTTLATNGGAVQQWTGTINNTVLSQATLGNRPKYMKVGSSTGLNFSAALSHVLASSSVGLGNLSQLSFFVALRMNCETDFSGTPSYGCPLNYCVAGSNPLSTGSFGLCRQNAYLAATGQNGQNFVFGAPDTGPGGAHANQSTDCLGVAIMAGMTLDGSNANAYWGSLGTPYGVQAALQDWNGSPAATMAQAANIATNGVFRVGQWSPFSTWGAGQFDGQIYGIVIVKGAMSQSDIINLQRYFINQRTLPQCVVPGGAESHGHWGTNGTLLSTTSGPAHYAGSGTTTHTLTAGTLDTQALQGLGSGWSTRRIYMLVMIDYNADIVQGSTTIGGVSIDVKQSIGNNASDFSWYVISARVPTGSENGVVITTNVNVTNVQTSSFIVDDSKLSSIQPTAVRYDYLTSFATTMTSGGIAVSDGGLILCMSCTNVSNLVAGSVGGAQIIYLDAAVANPIGSSGANIYGYSLPNAWWGLGFGCEIPAGTVTTTWGWMNATTAASWVTSLTIGMVALR